MGLFSFLFSKHKLLRTTYEAETFRAVFREDEELFLRVEKGEVLSLRKDGKKSNSSLIRTANIIKQNGNIKLCSRCVSYNLIC